jgi:SAM-dependent methyltransferase
MTRPALNLGALEKRNYNVSSCDISSYAINFCKSNVNSNAFVIKSSGLEELNSEVFDLIIMRGVFQHLSSPTDTLDKLKSCVRVGGYFAILATPNIESRAYRVTGELPTLSWKVVRNLPSLSSIRHALEYSDFKILAIQKPYFFSGYAAPIKDAAKYLLNLLGLKVGMEAFPGNVVNVLGVRLR